MAASANFALKAGAWFRRGRLLIVSPDSLGTACPLSGRNSTYRPVQISGTSSVVRRQDGKLHAATVEESVGSDEEGIEALVRKGRIDLADRRGFEDLDLQPDGMGGFLPLPQRSLGGCRIGRD